LERDKILIMRRNPIGQHTTAEKIIDPVKSFQQLNIFSCLNLYVEEVIGDEIKWV
jgi:hypothetical protein